MNLNYTEFSIDYNIDNNTLSFTGSIRMNDMIEYTKIKKFLLDIYSLESPDSYSRFYQT